MPIYEYLCKDCNTVFDALRGMGHADDDIACARCSSGNTVRKISLFAAHSQNRVVAGRSSGGCASCASGACSSCAAA
jgi:putative FmdB family regulatory protein